MIKQIAAMHGILLHYSGYTASRSKFFHERTWYQLAKAGFTVEDVGLYTSWIADQNKGREEKYKRKFSIPKMFGDLKKFEAELNEARAWQRNIVKPTAKEVALRELRPVVSEVAKDSAQSVRDVVGRVMQKITKKQRTDERRIGPNTSRL